eukprot:scaffold12160_cov60-Phaeocystis_antarctica.AAC.9
MDAERGCRCGSGRGAQSRATAGTRVRCRPRVVQAQRLENEVDRRGQHEEVRVLPEQPHGARWILQAVLHLVRVRVRVRVAAGIGVGTVVGEGAAHPLADVRGRRPRRLGRALAALQALQHLLRVRARVGVRVGVRVGALRHLVAVGEVTLAPRQPLVELGVIDAAVEEDDEPQPGAAKRADEVTHVAPQLQELPAAYPVERPVWTQGPLAEAGGCPELGLALVGRAGRRTARLLVELADERHPVDHHGVGGAGAQRCELDDVIGERQAVLHV